MELTWQTSCPLSALHMAWVVASGRPLLDSSFHSQLAPLAIQLEQWAVASQWPSQTFWQQLLTLAGDELGIDQLAARLIALQPSRAANDQLASALDQTLRACLVMVNTRYPRMAEELDLRMQPLQAAWEARGPGLMFQLRETSGSAPAAEWATVILVQPAAGGAGLAHRASQRVHMEAVLTDIEPRLPETLRLAWLISQTLQEQPTRLNQLALIPAVLAAAEEVQLSTLSHHTIQLGLTHWLRWPERELERPSQALYHWWQARSSQASQPWSTAVVDLAELLGDPGLAHSD